MLYICVHGCQNMWLSTSSFHYLLVTTYMLHIGPHTNTKQKVTYCCNILTPTNIYTKTNWTDECKLLKAKDKASE